MGDGVFESDFEHEIGEFVEGLSDAFEVSQINGEAEEQRQRQSHIDIFVRGLECSYIYIS